MGIVHPNTQQNKQTYQETNLAMQKTRNRAPVQKGNTQEVEAAGFEQEAELQTCRGPLQLELSYDLISFSW